MVGQQQMKGGVRGINTHHQKLVVTMQDTRLSKLLITAENCNRGGRIGTSDLGSELLMASGN
jgi:hypothetical protein